MHIVHTLERKIMLQSEHRHLPVSKVIWENPDRCGEGRCTLRDDAEIVYQSGNKKISGRRLKELYGFDHIIYSHGEPDFTPVRDQKIGIVEISEFSSDRQKNFRQARIQIAERWGISVADVDKYMESHFLTWHECSDRKRLIAVPTAIHDAFLHSGGISIQKSLNRFSERWQGATFGVTRSKITKKKIAVRGGADMAGRSLSRSRNPESSRVRSQETQEVQSEYKEYIKLGEKFEADRAELDRIIEIVEMSDDKDDDYKKKARAKYEYAVAKLQEKYDRDVKAYEEALEQKMIEQEEADKESSLEKKRVAEEVRKAKLEVAEVGVEDIAEQAEQASRELEDIAKANAEKRKLLAEQAAIQNRKLRAQRLRGK